jgi:hypothetical protein
MSLTASKEKKMDTQKTSSEFPDTDYIPFSKGEQILNDLVGFTIDDVASLVGADFWGLYIRHENLKVTPIYNAYPFRDTFTPRDMPEWLNTIRNRLLSDWKTEVLSKVEAGETLVLLMFGWEGWAVNATRVAEDQWRFKFRRHRDYGKSIALQIDKLFMFRGHTLQSKQDKIILEADNLSYITGETEQFNGDIRRYLEIYMRDGSIVTVNFVPDLVAGGPPTQFRTIVEWHPKGTQLPADPEKRLESDHEDGRKLLDWLDRHSRFIPIY